MNTAISTKRSLGLLKNSLRRTRKQQKEDGCRHYASRAAIKRVATASPPPPMPRPALSQYTIFKHNLTNRHNYPEYLRRTNKHIRTAFAVYQPVRPPVPSTMTFQTPETKSLVFAPGARKWKPNPTVNPAVLSPYTNPNKDPMPALHKLQIARLDTSGSRTWLFSKQNPDSARVGDVLIVSHRKGGEPFAGVLMTIRRRGIESSVLLRNHLTRIGVEMWFKIYSRSVRGIEIVKRRIKRARRARLLYMRQPKHDLGNVDNLVFAWKKNRHTFVTRGAKAKPGKKTVKK